MYVTTIAINLAVSGIYVVLVLRDWKRQPPEIRKGQVFNTAGIIASLGFTQYFLAGFFYNLTRVSWSIPFDPFPLVFIAVATVPGTIALILRKIKPKTPEQGEQIRKFLPAVSASPQTAIRRDLLRKGTHILIFVAIFAMDLIGFYISDAIFNDPFTFRTRRLRAWGIGNRQYLSFAWEWEDWVSQDMYISSSKIILFVALYCLTLLMLTSELCRHSRRWHYTFEKSVYRTLRPRELDRMAAYALFAAGFLLANLFLPYFGIMGMLAGWSLGDLAASQVGMRWGRHRFRHQDKTCEGLIAGALVSFIAAWPFLGVAWAGALTATFVGIDLLTERPIPMSDNILLPLAALIAFTFLQQAGIFIDSVFVALV